MTIGQLHKQTPPETYNTIAGYIIKDTTDETAPAVANTATTAAVTNCPVVGFGVILSLLESEYTLEATVSSASLLRSGNTSSSFGTGAPRAELEEETMMDSN
jgi:hypothetical protein